MNQDNTGNNQEQNDQEDEDLKLYPHQLPLTTLFAWFIGILNGKAWEHLGLMMNPETKEVKQDLVKAKVAIDSIEFLLNQIKSELEVEDRRQLENILANLQMNYVERNSSSQKTEEKKEEQPS
ncbi:MAG: DUF1844 domain-containing protein [Candidatus Atribacteria bacterium]|nr:DUF1844 domain-containing protein [Candidatus Atribacteria bacterium]